MFQVGWDMMLCRFQTTDQRTRCDTPVEMNPESHTAMLYSRHLGELHGLHFYMIHELFY